MEKKLNFKFCLIFFFLIFIIISFRKSAIAQTNDFDYLKEISGVWQDAGDGIMEIRLDKEEKYFTAKDIKLFVEPIEVDSVNNIIKLKLIYAIDGDGDKRELKNKGDAFFYFRMVFDEEQKYHLIWMQEIGGKQSPKDVDLFFKHK
jgi:hypothetical protein